MKKTRKVLAMICLISMLFSIFSIAAAAKSNDDEEYRLVAIAGKLYKVLESDEVKGSVEQADYIAIKTKYITSALGGVVSDMDTPGDVSDNTEDSTTDTKEDTSSDTTDTSEDSTTDTAEDNTADTENAEGNCTNGVCYVDSVLDEEPSENTEKTTVLDDEETIALYEANTEGIDTSIDSTVYPYLMKSKLDEKGVKNTIWTITTKEGHVIYANVFTLESGKELKAFTYNGKPREITTLSEGSDLMAKRLLCKTCNLKKSFGVVETISK